MARRSRLEISPADIPRAILRRKIVFLLVFGVVSAVAVVAALRMKFRYESGFQVLIKPGARESFSVEHASLQGDPISDRTGGTTYANAVAILQSTDLVDRLVARLEAAGGLDPDPSAEATETDPSSEPNPVAGWVRKLLYPPEYAQQHESEREEWLAYLRGKLAAAIDVSPIHGTTVLQITVTWTDPNTAYRISSLLVDVCRQHYGETYRSAEDIGFLDKKVAETESGLEKLIERQESLRIEAGVSDIEQEMHLILTQIDALSQQNTECQVTEAAAKGQVNSLRQKLETTPSELPGDTTSAINPRYTYLYNQLLSLELRKLESPFVNRENTQIDLKIKRILEELDKEDKWIEAKRPGQTNPVYTSLLQEINKLEAQSIGTRGKCDTILSEVQRLRARYNQLRMKQAALKELSLERAMYEADLMKWKRTLQAAHLADQLAQGQVSNLKVIQRPEFDASPIKNRRPLAVGLGLFAALVAAALVCFVLFLRFAEIGTPEELRSSTGLTVLASIPDHSGWHCLLPGRFFRQER